MHTALVLVEETEKLQSSKFHADHTKRTGVAKPFQRKGKYYERTM